VFLLCSSCIHYCFSLFNFCIESYKRVFWSFPTKEPIFSPCNLSLSLFNLFSWIINQVLYKNHLVCIWVSLSRFCPRGILVFSHYLNFGQRGILKYLIFGSLFVLVRFVNFKRFTLRSFQVTFLANFIIFYILVQILLKITIWSKYFVFLQVCPNSFRKRSNFFYSFKNRPIFFICKVVPYFTYLQIGPQGQKEANSVQKATQAVPSPRGTSSLAHSPHVSLYKALGVRIRIRITPHHTNRILILSLGS